MCCSVLRPSLVSAALFFLLAFGLTVSVCHFSFVTLTSALSNVIVVVNIAVSFVCEILVIMAIKWVVVWCIARPEAAWNPSTLIGGVFDVDENSDVEWTKVAYHLKSCCCLEMCFDFLVVMVVQLALVVAAAMDIVKVGTSLETDCQTELHFYHQ